ncbi:MAG: response regulator [Terriglobales bacterium]|jgi:CheY-like chemotaxis protein
MHSPDSNRGVEASVCASTVDVSNRAVPTILLVEDEAFVREVACEILRVAGYRVLSARNAAEAVPAFLAHREEVQLLLADVVLPDRNGPDLAFELVTLGHAFRTIFISGYPENSVTRNGVQKPGWFYLPKPFSAAALVQKVNEVMNQASI